MGGQGGGDERIAALEKEVARLEQELEKAREQRLEEDAARAKEVRCPKCRFLMEERVEHGITVDVCPGCRGVYFDDGEVNALIKEIEEQRPQPSFFSRLFGR